MQHYDVPIHKNDDNDSFDEKELLRHVPESQKAKARVLIKFCNQYPEQITWNHDGVIFIDQVSIPNSNIFRIFHCLFSPACASTAGSRTGLDELLHKIKEMHLDHLTFLKGEKEDAKDESNLENLPDFSSDDSSSDLPWWFLG